MGGEGARPERDSISVEEHERLRRDLDALREQFEAADEVLSAMGRSATDPDTVLADRSSRARAGSAGRTRPTSTSSATGSTRLITVDGAQLRRRSPSSPSTRCRSTARRLIGRVGLDRRTQQIPDVLADPEYGRYDIQRIAGFRTTMVAAPMLIDDEVVGALTLWRNDVHPVRRTGRWRS